MNNKVRQKVLIALKFGRIKIKINKSWGLPFSLYSYQTKNVHFSITQYMDLIECVLFHLCIIFAIHREEW